jgi:WD40 repeat protein
LFGAVGVLLALSGFTRGEAPKFDDDGPLPPRAVARLGTYRLWDGGCISALAFSPDGKLVASGESEPPWRPEAPEGGAGDELKVCLWETATGRVVRRIAVPASQEVFHLAFAPDGKMLAGACGDTVLVWEVPSGRELLRLGPNIQAEHFLRFSADGKALTGGQRDCIESWELATGKRLRSWRPWKDGPPRREDGQETEACDGCALSPDGRFVAWEITHRIGKDGTFAPHALRVCDAATGKLLYQLDRSSDEFACPTFSPDGRLLVTGCQMIRLWDAASGRYLGAVTDDYRGAGTRAFSPDGRALASADGGVVFLWDVKARAKLRQWEFLDQPSAGSLGPLAFSPDGKLLAIGGEKKILLRQVNTGKDRPALPGIREPVSRLAFSPDGRALTAYGRQRTPYDQQTICRWKVATWEEGSRLVRRPRWLPETGSLLAVSPDARTCAYRPPTPNATAQVCDLQTGKLLRPVKGPHADFTLVGDEGQYSGDGKRVFLLIPDPPKTYLLCFAAGSGEEVAWVQLPHDGLHEVSFEVSQDGKSVAWIEGGRLALADVGTGKVVRRFAVPPAAGEDEPPRFRLFALSPDGQLLAATLESNSGGGGEGQAPQVIHVWRVATGEELHRLALPPGRPEADYVTCLAFSPDGRTLATGRCGEKAARLWEMATGWERGRLEGHREWVLSLAFSPDGLLLASGGADGVVTAWDATGALTGTPAGTKPSEADLAALWDRLADADARRGWEAVRALVAASDAGVPFLRERLRPARTAPERVAGLVADLDSDRFAVRDRARRELEALHEAAAPGLAKALRGTLSLEVRRRAERLLARAQDCRSPQALRQVRAVEALEHIGSAEARRLLEELAGGVPEARLTQEAQASLRRLAARAASPVGRDRP